MTRLEQEQTIEEQISEFYRNLSDAQELLGHDFEKVLYDNLWDLYDNDD